MKRLGKIWNDDYVLMHSHYDTENDRLYVTVKSAKTNLKTKVTLSNPKIPIYVLKDEIDSHRYRTYVKKSDCNEYWVSAKYRIYEIADILGIKNYAEKVKAKVISYNHVYLNKRLFGADLKVEDYVMRDYVYHHTKSDGKGGTPTLTVPILDKIHIGALDVETDILVSDVEEERPLNVITYIDNETKVIKTIAVKNKNYKGQSEIIRNPEAFKIELFSLIERRIMNLSFDSIDNEEKRKRKENDVRAKLLEFSKDLKLDLTFVNSERTMIKDMCSYVFNNVNPDFLYIYNAKYDIGKIKMRAEALRMNFANLFKFKDNEAYANIDWGNEFIKSSYDIKDVKHSYNFNNPTKLLDQWINYYQNRIATNYSKTTLDATVEREVGTHKLEWSHICNYIGDLPYVDYRTYLLYNIVDVLVMLYLDIATQDTRSNLYTRFNFVTEWERLFSPKQSVMNVYDYYSYYQGYVTYQDINNQLMRFTDDKMNKLKEKDPDLYNVIQHLKETDVEDRSKNPHRIEGGLVTNPNLISNKIKNSTIYDGLPIKTFNKFLTAADNDATSMYPSNNVANNASRETLYGRVYSIDGYKDEYDISVRLNNAIINEDISTLGNMLYSLPNVHELLGKYKNVKYVTKDNAHKYANINSENFQLDSISKDAKSYISWWNACYKTKYNTTSDVMVPSSNKLIIFSDRTTEEFSYYGTKVTVTTSKSTNSLLGIDGSGLHCGIFKSNDLSFQSFHEDYVEYLKIDKEDPEIDYLMHDGEFDINFVSSLGKAKFRTMRINFTNDIYLDVLGRVIFSNYRTPIRWEIYKIKNNNKCIFIRLSSNYVVGDVNIQVEQHIISYYDKGR